MLIITASRDTLNHSQCALTHSLIKCEHQLVKCDVNKNGKLLNTRLWCAKNSFWL